MTNNDLFAFGTKTLSSGKGRLPMKVTTVRAHGTTPTFYRRRIQDVATVEESVACYQIIPSSNQTHSMRHGYSPDCMGSIDVLESILNFVDGMRDHDGPEAYEIVLALFPDKVVDIQNALLLMAKQNLSPTGVLIR